MNLFGEIVLLTLIFLTSMALTAFTVGLSGCSSVIVRALLPIFGLPIMLWSIAAMFLFSGMRGSSDMMDMFSLDNNESRIGVAVYVAALIYIGWSMLSLGASLIAPAAENHSLWRRVVALTSMAVLVPITAIADMDDEMVMLLVFVIAVPAIVIALTDSSHLVSTVCKPFVKRGMAGKVLGWLLYPTWHSGILYAIVLGMVGVGTVLTHSIVLGNGMINDADEAVVLFSIFGGLYFPAVWQLFLFRGEGQRIAHYLLLLVGSFVMLGILVMLAESMNSGGFLWAFAWNPLAFLAMLEESKLDDTTLLLGVLIVDVVLLGILACAAVAGLGKSSAVLREAELTDESQR